MADIEEIIEIRELPIKTEPSSSDYLVVDDESTTNRIKFSDLKSNVTRDVQEQIDTLEDTKQDTLVSGENIKTINNESLLGSGDISLPTSSEVEDLVNAEKDAREENEKIISQAISTEVENRENADSELQDHIDAEKQAREDADKELSDKVSEEETNRKLADTSLQNSLNKCKKVFEYLNPTETTYLIRHDLSTKDFLINVYSINGKDLYPTIKRLDGDNVQLTFESIPNSFRVVMFAINEWGLRQLAFKLIGG